MHVVYKRRWRARTVENIIDELEIISKNKKISDVFFVDDNILVDMKRVGHLCIEIIRGKREKRIKKNLRFFFQGRLDSMARYPTITKLMGKAGFWLVLVGVEATNDETLKIIDKGCNVENIKRGIEVLHESGILVMGNVILGANLNDSIDDVFVTIKKT
ncbi:MAG: B12-binding domain-containing radical SAM protein, partial [Promethearchaeota archaeon]